MFYTNMGSGGQDPGPNYPNIQMLQFLHGDRPVGTQTKLFRIIFTVSGINLPV